MAEDKHSKTEAPTAKKKKEARKEGQVVRSEDLVTWTCLLIATTVMPGMISRASKVVTDSLREMVALARHPDERLLTAAMGRSFLGFLSAVLPAMATLLVIAVLGNLAQVGLLLTGKPLKPKWSQIGRAHV